MRLSTTKKAMFDNDAMPYAYSQWDGAWDCDDLTSAAKDLFSTGYAANFVSWKTGTISAGSASFGGSGAPTGLGAQGGAGGGASYHMASFDYAYNCVAVMEWLFQQSR